MRHQSLPKLKNAIQYNEKTYWKTRHNHGGMLRRLKSGRKARPLSTKNPLHVVYKADRSVLREKSLRGYRSFDLTQKIIHKYAAKFWIQIEQISVQGDHIHILVRCKRRSQFKAFFRVTSGQIAQEFQKQGLLKKMTDTPSKEKKGTSLWRFRPFSRIVLGWKAYQTVRDYIQLNEKEALGIIKYNKERLRALSPTQRQLLWS